MNEETKKKIEDKAIEYGYTFDRDKRAWAEQDFKLGAEFGYSLASEELKRKDEQLTDCGKKYFELKSLLQSREELLKEIRKGGWDHIEMGKRIDDLLAQSEKL